MPSVKALSKYFPAVAGALLGLLFVFASLVVLLGLAPEPPAMPPDTPMAHFMAAFVPTHYLTFVKVCELLGGLLVAWPRTRNAGLLVLGPVIVNIVAFHVFVNGGATLLDPMVIGACVLAGYLLWIERRAFLGLVRRPLTRAGAPAAATPATEA